MWQPSGLVDVLIKCCCCNISGTWFVGVILVIYCNSEYVIVIYWSLFGSVKICKDLQNSTDLYRMLQKNVSSFLHKKDFSRNLNIFIIRMTLLWGFIVFPSRSVLFRICTYLQRPAKILKICTYLQRFSKFLQIFTDSQRSKTWKIDSFGLTN